MIMSELASGSLKLVSDVNRHDFGRNGKHQRVDEFFFGFLGFNSDGLR